LPRTLRHDGFGGVPQDAAVDPVGVERDHGVVQVLIAGGLFGGGVEVVDVASRTGDVLGAVGVAVALVAGDDRGGGELLDGLDRGEPVAASGALGLGEVEVDVAVDGVAGDD